MKNYSLYFLVAAFLVLITSCKDDKDDVVISSSKVKVGTLTVVTAVQDGEAVEKNTAFFEEGDEVTFQYKQSGSSAVTFTGEKTSDSWEALSKELYYKDIYPNGKEPESFIAEFGSKELTTDQSTAAKFHAAHYLYGEAYVKSSNANLMADSIWNKHILVIVNIIKSNNWGESPAFENIVNANTLTIHTTGEQAIKPLYEETQANRAIYYAIVPEGMVPAAGNSIFTLNDESVTYSFVDGGYAPKAGQTLVVTAWYNYENQIKATALTRDAWDITGTGKYGYPLVEEVSSIQDIEALALSVSSGVDYTGKMVTLKNNLDLNGESILPVGTQDYPFNGTFLGGNFTLKNFMVNDNTANAALFGSVGVNGTVKELTIENFSVETNASYASALAGSNYGYILSCQVKNAEIIGGNYIGGVVGYNDGTIAGCKVGNSSINSMKQTLAIAGGIAGFNYRNVIACDSEENKVQVLTRSENKFGLLIGENSNQGNIDRCRWSGEQGFPAVGYSIKMPDNSTAEQLRQAITDYNKDKKEGDIRYCKNIF